MAIMFPLRFKLLWTSPGKLHRLPENMQPLYKILLANRKTNLQWGFHHLRSMDSPAAAARATAFTLPAIFTSESTQREVPRQ